MTTFDPHGVRRRPDDLDAAWLTAALGLRLLPAGAAVTGYETTPVGTGQVADTVRIALTYDPPQAGPPSVVAKFAAADEGSRRAGLLLRLYEVELSFYLDVASAAPVPAGVPRLAYAGFDPAEGWFTLILEDLAPAVVGDDVAGCDPAVAEAALHRLAVLQAAYWESAALAALPWLNRTTAASQATTATLVGALAPGFLARFAPLLAPEHVGVVERFVPRFGAWLAGDGGPRTLSHGDYRLDNMLFRPGDAEPVVVDWQTVVWGHPAADVAYLLGGSLSAADRRAHGERLLDGYHRTLLAHGVSGYSRAQLDADVRYRSAGGVVMAVGAAMLVGATARGDAMFAAAVGRHAQHVLDRRAEEVFPAPAGPPPHLVTAADEHRHPAGPEELWNESWYADVVSADGSLGAYVRLGLYPNTGAGWLHLVVCGPGRPLVACAVDDLPIPDGPLRIAVPGVELDLTVDEALATFTVRAEVAARAYDGPRALYAGQAGEPAAVALTATWRTDGSPYHYDLTTRYEVPCLVTGTVTVDGELLDLTGPGQRDHSWGVRDWWSFGWCWAAARLDDGERLHVADIRLPDARLAFGYRQAGGAVTPVTALAVTETVDSDGLAPAARIEAQGTGYAVTPLAWGPALLVAPDGRVARFPRAMARYQADDGRLGTGWIEWNQPPAG